eukprot:4999497-Prymnesium_polylepis.1
MQKSVGSAAGLGHATPSLPTALQRLPPPHALQKSVTPTAALGHGVPSTALPLHALAHFVPLLTHLPAFPCRVYTTRASASLMSSGATGNIEWLTGSGCASVASLPLGPAPPPATTGSSVSGGQPQPTRIHPMLCHPEVLGGSSHIPHTIASCPVSCSISNEGDIGRSVASTETTGGTGASSVVSETSSTASDPSSNHSVTSVVVTVRRFLSFRSTATPCATGATGRFMKS